ncbi:MAG: hypothetical protein AB1815_01865 [Bacillota bacterium]
MFKYSPASMGSSLDSANIQRGLNPPLNEVSFNRQGCLSRYEGAISAS